MTLPGSPRALERLLVLLPSNSRAARWPTAIDSPLCRLSTRRSSDHARPARRRHARNGSSCIRSSSLSRSRSRKQACDRVRPSCSHCARRNVFCDYECVRSITPLTVQVLIVILVVAVHDARAAGLVAGLELFVRSAGRSGAAHPHAASLDDTSSYIEFVAALSTADLDSRGRSSAAPSLA